MGSTSVRKSPGKSGQLRSSTIAALDRNDCRLPALDRELDRNIVPRSVRVGTDFLVRLAGESLELRLRERRVLYVQLHCDAESARVARPDRHAASDGCALGVLLLLDRNKIECATEAGGVTDGEQMFGCGRVGSTGTAHGLGHR
jgi:hypothetical protein